MCGSLCSRYYSCLASFSFGTWRAMTVAGASHVLKALAGVCGYMAGRCEYFVVQSTPQWGEFSMLWPHCIVKPHCGARACWTTSPLSSSTEDPRQH